MTDVSMGPLLFVITLIGTVASIIGVIYVFSAMKFLKHAKFWRASGISFTLSTITFWIIICLHTFGRLQEWGWVFLAYYVVISPIPVYLSIKMRREIHKQFSGD